MVLGLSYAQFRYLRALAAGCSPADADARVRRHCEFRRWTAGGRLTDDGREVLKRAELDPPPKQVYLGEAGRLGDTRPPAA